MAKTAKLKSNSKSKSIHSRAAKREVSPSLNLDKSITSAPRVEQTTHVPSVLAAQHGSGVSKKKNKPKSRAQRMRQEKGMERAEKVMDMRETKLEASEKRAKRVQARRAAWEELNGKVPRATGQLNFNNQETDSMDTSEKEGEPELLAPVPSNHSTSALPPVQDQKFDFEMDGEIS